MADMSIFGGKAFSMVEMTDAVNLVPHKPMGVSQLNLFPVRRIRTEFAFVSEREGAISVIQTSERGDPIGTDKGPIKEKRRAFKTPRLADAATVNASEIAGITAFGSESELKQVQTEIAQRLDNQTGLMAGFELTWERMRLGAVQGLVLDADGSTLYNWFDEFQISQAGEIDFDLDNATPASGAVRKKCNQVIRQMKVASKGAWIDGQSSVMALCGDAFFDDLVAHSEVRGTYLNQIAAAELRTIAMPYEEFNYGGIRFRNYRGTDDGTTVGVNTDKACFFPINSPGVFACVASPGEFFGVVNQPGRDLYSRLVLDPDANGIFSNAAWVKAELYSYMMFMCLRPAMLQRAKRT